MARRAFISYAANDPDWPEADVRRLAEWIQRQGVEPLLDVWHVQSVGRKLSIDEWRTWMREGQTSADHVLCLCSSKYQQAWARDGSQSGGCGVAFESTYIEQHLYDRKQNNNGRVLTLSRKHGQAGVPITLKAVCADYVWEGGDADGLLSSHLAGNPPEKPAPPNLPPQVPGLAQAASGAVSSMLSHQSGHSVELLKEAPALWRALRQSSDMTDYLGGVASDSPEDLMRRLGGKAEDADAIQNVMYEVHELFCCVGPKLTEPDERRRCAQAAVALYLYCSCLLIKACSADLLCGLPRLESDDAAQLMAGLIGVHLAGGSLRLVAGKDPDLPSVTGTVALNLEGMDQAPLFERELHSQIMLESHAIQAGLKLGPLTKQERADLIQRIKTLRGRGQRLKAFNVVVRGRSALANDDVAWITALSVPVFTVHHDETFELLAGISPEDVIAMLKELWRSVSKELAEGAERQDGASTLPASPDLVELAAAIQSLVAELKDRPEAQNLRTSAEQLQSAAKDKRSPGRDLLEQTKDTLEGLEKVGEVGEKLLPRLMQLLNLFL